MHARSFQPPGKIAGQPFAEQRRRRDGRQRREVNIGEMCESQHTGRKQRRTGLVNANGPRTVLDLFVNYCFPLAMAGTRMRKRLALAGGMATILFVLSPPFAGAAAQLFAFHMAQHLLLIAVAAPLLAAGRIFQPRGGRPVFRALRTPAAGWTVFVGVFLFWHWPGAFRWSARHAGGEWLEHGSILFGALLFWDAVFSPRNSFGYAARGLFVIAAAAVTDIPAVIMVFSPVAICAMPRENALRWGLDPLDDQRIAGMLMWVPANMVFILFAIWFFSRWLAPMEKRLEPETTK